MNFHGFVPREKQRYIVKGQDFQVGGPSVCSLLLPLSSYRHYGRVTASLCYCISSDERELHSEMVDIKEKWHLALHMKMLLRREGIKGGFPELADPGPFHVTGLFIYLSQPRSR